jgi:hypothetical protein
MTLVAQKVRGPNLAVLVKAIKGVPFEEGLARADKENRVIASNARLSKALIDSGEWENIREIFPCWSGTMTAYVEPGRKLGEQVESVVSETGHRWVFAVPYEYRDQKNAILIVEHPDYSLEIDGNNRVVHAKAVALVKDFPEKSRWYKEDPIHAIPAGSELGRFFSDSAMQLWRTDKRVGPVGRDFGLIYHYGAKVIVLSLPPTADSGMAVESSEKL